MVRVKLLNIYFTMINFIDFFYLFVNFIELLIFMLKNCYNCRRISNFVLHNRKIIIIAKKLANLFILL